MKAKKTAPQPELSTILLLLAVISALFVLFGMALRQRPVKDYFPPAPVPTVKPMTRSTELDSALQELDQQDSTAAMNAELQKLNSDSAGI